MKIFSCRFVLPLILLTSASPVFGQLLKLRGHITQEVGGVFQSIEVNEPIQITIDLIPPLGFGGTGEFGMKVFRRPAPLIQIGEGLVFPRMSEIFASFSKAPWNQYGALLGLRLSGTSDSSNNYGTNIEVPNLPFRDLPFDPPFVPPMRFDQYMLGTQDVLPSLETFPTNLSMNAFTNTTGTLKLTTVWDPRVSLEDSISWVITSYEFGRRDPSSLTPVPEVSNLALFACGGLAIAIIRRRKKRIADVVKAL